ncbi:MAG: 2-C-methyl-D-erythritol 2,4-cyclodiphosphate synthase, partial [Deltaproteobacteria bacterium]
MSYPRVGIGYDIHRLEAGRKLYLGGVEIPYVKGLLGHSDADVLLHAVIDALLGAAGMADIGELFPDTDPAFHDIRSTELLRRVYAMLREHGFSIGNIDIVLIAEEPKMGPFKKQIRRQLAALLGIEE